MKIDQLSVVPYSILFTIPLQTSMTTYTHREGVWIHLQCENISGFGEIAPLPGFSTETLQEVHYALEGIRHAIEGQIFDKEELLSMIQVHSEGNPSLRFGLETAVYDLLAKQNNQSISIYLNSYAKSIIMVNGLESIHNPDDDYKVIKVKVGYRNLFDEIEYMENLCKTYGEEILFRLDANGAFDLPRAIRFCKEMEKFNIDYIEQPLPSDELVDLFELSYHTELPIAVDESLTDFSSAEKIIKEQAAHVFIIKPMISGGYTESKKIIQLAKKENIRSIITSSLETSVGRLSCMHIAAANNIEEACGLATGKLLDEQTSLPEIIHGEIKIPNQPGLGIDALQL